MIFWLIAIAVTAVACAALFYAAAGREVNAASPDSGDTNNHFKLLLAGIDADVASGKLGPDQALAARAELAREVLRSKGDVRTDAKSLGQGTILIGLGAIAALSLGLYAAMGHPEMSAQPLAGRAEVAAQNLDLDAAITQIEARLAADPDDVRGWTVIAPAYVELGRFDDAAEAYRRVIALSEPTAELQTDLAEALMLAAGDAGSEEALQLLQDAVESDPAHVRSRLYLAAELMRLQRYDEAAGLWSAAIDLSTGDEGWLPAARQGLAVAQNGGVETTADDQQQMISGMVAGLAERLAVDGGTIEEWTQLVRAYIVLNDLDKAQDAYDDAVAAYPAAFDRGDLDTLALGAGLVLNGGGQ
ncbi:c-type cytochrome biogenesis protein CcmI [Devosia rhizoryzae]|uniref:C-type cytochrome biogenesis protein CcmI n=1 Tax=Devosia rhizoryzae TaxID=2774137 RepID=A0ABX7C2D8_9HYPH|nr:c-type cytochrome biogenesis protein CcmI [Devosia rhizoryzae]QQR37933.1 c-type cytochrome biogenesis protein CcmI [Devosia rhizoryzae]